MTGQGVEDNLRSIVAVAAKSIVDSSPEGSRNRTVAQLGRMIDVVTEALAATGTFTPELSLELAREVRAMLHGITGAEHWQTASHSRGVFRTPLQQHWEFTFPALGEPIESEDGDRLIPVAISQSSSYFALMYVLLMPAQGNYFNWSASESWDDIGTIYRPDESGAEASHPNIAMGYFQFVPRICDDASILTICLDHRSGGQWKLVQPLKRLA